MTNQIRKWLRAGPLLFIGVLFTGILKQFGFKVKSIEVIEEDS